MKRVDRLLLRVQEAYRLDTLQLSIAFVEPTTGGKWQAIADLWDGKDKGETKRLIMECNTQEEALEAVDEVQKAHQPTGKRANTLYNSVVIIDDINED